MATLTHNQVIEAKTGNLFVLRWILHYADTALLLKALDLKMKQSGDFFRNEAVVLDATRIEKSPDWRQLKEAMAQHQLHLLGVMAPVSMFEAIKNAGLPILNLDKKAPITVKEGAVGTPVANNSPATTSTTAPAKTPVASQTTPVHHPSEPASSPAQATTAPVATTSGVTPVNNAMVIERHLRSGQRIYAQNADLIVIGTVSTGAEVIADGNIHIYGALRGRAIAGAQGNTKARIFCHQLEAEMIVIAGVYKVLDDPETDWESEHAVIVELHNDRLEVKKMSR